MSSPSSPNPSSRLPVWFLLLVAIGFPSAAGFTFARTVTQYPLQALGIALLYEVVLLLISFVTGVWQQLYNDWVKQIATWIDSRLRRFNYQRDYFEQLRHQYQVVSTRNLISGLSYAFMLEQIYVPSKLALTSSDQASPNPVRVPKRLHNSLHSVWDYLASESLMNQHLVILGAPGSGKSTLLRDMVLTLTNPKTRRQRPRIVYKLPFLLPLCDFSDRIKSNPSFSLADAVRVQVPHWKREMPQGWIEDQLARGQCLILLDGLDEIANQEDRQQMANWLQNQIDIYGNNNRFIVTSRPFGYDSNRLDGVMTLEVQEFNFAQIEVFIDKWYYAHYSVEARRLSQKDEGVHVKAEKGARDLLERLRNTSALLVLARNPLLLTMMVIIHQERDTLPGNRADLYKEMCQIFLERRTRWEFPSGQRQKVLQELACYMMKKGMEEIEPVEAASVIKEPLTYVSVQMTPEAFLQTVEKDGILIEGEQPGTYRFIHRTFREYLTAIYIRDNKLEQIIIDKVGSAQWRETIFLYCTTGDATPVMSACLRDNRLLTGAVELALDLVLYKEKVLVRSEVGEQFTHALSQAIEGEDRESRHKWAETLLTRRTQGLDRMASLNDETCVVDTSLITCAEYQLFLEEQENRGQNYWPDHWSNNHFIPGQGLMPILGIRPSDAVAFCNWLTEQDSSRIWRYRLPKGGELEQEDEKLGKVGRLSVGSGYWICENTHFTWAGEPKSQSITLKQLDDAFKKDQEDRDYYLSRHPNNSILHKSVMLANALLNVRYIHRELVDTLTDARKQILVCNRILQAELKKAQKEVLALQGQIKSENARETSQDYPLRALQNKIQRDQAKLKLVRQEISSLQSRLEEAQQSVHTVSSQLEKERKQFFLLRNKDRERTLQGQLQEALQPVNDIKSQLQELLQRERQLQNQINESQHEEGTLQYQHSKSKGDLHHRLEQAQPIADKLKADLKCLDTIHDICTQALIFSCAYGVDNAPNVLDLDHVLNIIKDETFKNALENAPTYASDFALSFAKDLAQDIALYNRDCAQISLINQDQIKISDIVATLTRAQGLAGKITSSHIITDTQQLAHTLFSYLGYLSKNRSKVRESPLTRWYIRYFARVLAGHLLYWWRKGPPAKHTLHLFNERHLENDMGKHIIDAYFNIYVAFTILEKRSDGDASFSPCEGILLVKECKEEIK